MTGPMLVRETGEPFGSPDVRWSCSCGFATDAFPAGEEHWAEQAMREHLADEHGTEVGAGRCANCGAATDWLLARSELGDAYLCETCAPEQQLREVLG